MFRVQGLLCRVSSVGCSVQGAGFIIAPVPRPLGSGGSDTRPTGSILRFIVHGVHCSVSGKGFGAGRDPYVSPTHKTRGSATRVWGQQSKV
jgi:hypothetical protein